MGGVPILFFLLLTTSSSSSSSSSSSVPLGSTITPTNSTSTWNSPNSTFSLSFLPTPSSSSSDSFLPTPSSSSSDSFLLAISYGTFPIWYPTSPNLTVGRDASFSLSPAGNLLLNSSSSTTLWQSNTSSRGVSSASLDDSGNLRLLNSTSAVLWQSFDHPTDTLIQTQSLTPSHTLNSGAYSFALSAAGNLTLKWNRTLTYYNRGNSSYSLTSPALVLGTNGIVNLLDSSLSVPGVVAYSSNYGEADQMMRFLRLDPDGNLRAYSVAKGGTAPTERWAAVADQCQVFGWCGPYGVCGYNDSSPVCGCPSQNFDPVDANDATKGCRRKLELQNCTNSWAMLQMDTTQFLTFPSQFPNEQFFVGISACRQNCLSGSSCVASTSLDDGSGFCYLKVSEPVSGYRSATLPSTSFVKVCAPAVPNAAANSASDGSGSAKSKLKAWVVAVVVVGTIAGLVMAEWGIWWCFCRNSPKFGPSSAQYALLEYASGAPVQFSYKELHKSTKGFKEKLGAGGFGAVYRGVLANRTVVAVKQLEGIEQGEKQFRMEVATISSTHHLNLVRLIGFCSEGRHRLLVYEFMKNGSLDAFLFSDESSGKLNWAARFKVAVGTARGITYLHEECRDCIVHCDIKPENILLDESYNAKVSDFGLAKLVNPKDHRHRTLTSVRGTRGYLAPEWLANLPITSKSDVYSYGMVLLETLSGRRNFDVSEETGRKKFSIWAYEEFDKGNVGSILDKRLPDSDVDMEQLERAVQVSFWCIQDQPSQRPSMGKVVQMLEGIVEIERPPIPKATDGSMTGTSRSVNITSAGSAPVLSSSSSVQVAAVSSSWTDTSDSKRLEKKASSLLAAVSTSSDILASKRRENASSASLGD